MRAQLRRLMAPALVHGSKVIFTAEIPGPIPHLLTTVPVIWSHQTLEAVRTSSPDTTAPELQPPAPPSALHIGTRLD